MPHAPYAATHMTPEQLKELQDVLDALHIPVMSGLQKQAFQLDYSPPSAGDFGPARRIFRIPVPKPIPQQLPEPEKEVKQDEPVGVPA